MNSSITKRFLKYMLCLSITILFQSLITQTSFADALTNNVTCFIQKSNDYGHEDHEGNDTEDDEGDDEEDDGTHNAGKNCLTGGCHLSGGEHTFSLGGTIYDDADGTNGRVGAKIKVTDANGSKILLRSDQLGNFYSGKNLTAPFTISVSYRGRTVTMPISATHGGCNADDCHVAGVEGRVFISTNDLDLTGTVTSSGTGGGSSEISYNNDIKSILDSKCVSCHKAGGAKSDTPLTTYAEVTDPGLVTPGSADSLLLRKLDKNSNEGTMWPNLNSTSDYNTIKDWIVKYNAQEYSSGQVSSGGEAVSGARISLSKNGRIKYRTKTDSAGEFIIARVKAGTYTLKVSRKGYETYTQSYQMNQTNVTPLEITMTVK